MRKVRKDKIDTEQFIINARIVHGDLYDYSLAEYTGNKNKIIVVCKLHGSFSTSPASHVNKKSICRRCFTEFRVNSLTTKFQRRSTEFSHITPPEGSRIIPLSRGAYTIVDEEDFDKLSVCNWYLSTKGYVTNNKLGKMHRFIMGITDKKLVVDHKFHDKTDNRKLNLRVCTNQENSCNGRSKKIKASKYKGVYLKGSRWAVSVSCNRKQYKVGSFISEVEAAHAYDAKAQELHGEFAFLNFPSK